MIQQIITYIIIAAAFLIVFYKLYLSFAKPHNGCDGCSSSCNNCSLSNLKQEIEKNKKKIQTK